MSNDVRHRLIPSRGTGTSWFVLGQEEALAQAEAAFQNNTIPVVVCSFPVGGVIRQIALVGAGKTPKRL